MFNSTHKFPVDPVSGQVCQRSWFSIDIDAPLDGLVLEPTRYLWVFRAPDVDRRREGEEDLEQDEGADDGREELLDELLDPTWLVLEQDPGVVDQTDHSEHLQV